MSKRDRGTYFAIGLVLGVGIAALFLIWTVPEFRNPTFAYEYYQQWQANAGREQNQQPNGTHYWIRSLHGWVFLEDSLAQWLMACLGLAATAISVLALVWLKGTWKETRRTANAAIEQTRIMRNADRPILTPTNIRIKGMSEKYWPDKKKMPNRNVWVEFDVLNLGSKPAFLRGTNVGVKICPDRASGQVELENHPRTERILIPAEPEKPHKIDTPVCFPDISFDQWVSVARAHQNFLYIIGNITYMDLIGVLRETGFIYQLVTSLGAQDIEIDDRPIIPVSGTNFWYDREIEPEEHHG